MFRLPLPTHKLHKIEENGRVFIADLDACRIVEASHLAWRILQLCPELSNEEIIYALQEEEKQEEIIKTMEWLEERKKEGLFFEEDIHLTQKGRMRVLAPTSSPYGTDLRWKAIGAPISHQKLLKALSRYADVYINHKENLSEGFNFFPLNPKDLSSVLRTMEFGFDGVLIFSPTEMEFLPLLSYIDVPFVVCIRQQRGGGGAVINSVLRWYAFMRDYDAFMVLTESGRKLYSRFALDDSFFQIVPNGVDLDLFRPMDKEEAKREIAEMLGQPEICRRKVVGFLSRALPEKGMGLFLKIAEMNPDHIFLVVVPDLGFYFRYRLPENLVYAGRQPREKLTLFFSAFDLLCFPTMVGWEAFSRVTLEAMACGTPVVVPHIDGMPYLVEEGGIVVECEEFRDELGSFAGYVSLEKMSEAVNDLLCDDERRLEMGRRAREIAEKYSWENSAKELIKLFKKLILKRRFDARRRRFEVAFTRSGSLLLNLTEMGESPLFGDLYLQTVEEGLALTLLKGHTLREVEAILFHFLPEERVREILVKAKGFVESTS